MVYGIADDGGTGFMLFRSYVVKKGDNFVIKANL